MPRCIHFCVCAFKVKAIGDESFCTATQICKFYSEGDKAIEGGSATKVKRHYKKRQPSARCKPDTISLGEDINDCDITKKQFKKARKKISNAQQHGKLDENQEKALESLKGLRFKTATAAQKEQIVSIAKDL